MIQLEKKINSGNKEKQVERKPRFTIIHDRPNCISCAACETVSPNWTLATEDGKADPINDKISEKDFKENMEAAELCPVNIIHIRDEKEKKDLI